VLGVAIIVFREVLEAALIIGVVAAASRGIGGRARALGAGIGAGVIGAVLVAVFAESISHAARGIGQELFNAIVLGLAVLMLAWHSIWMAQHGAAMAADARRVTQDVREGTRGLSAIVLVAFLAVLREGAETVLFLYGMAAGGDLSAASVAAGGALGRPHIAAALLEAGYVSDHPQAFAKYIGEGCPAYVEKYKIRPDDAVEAIHAAGGLAFVAHPGYYLEDERAFRALLERGFDGIEVYHPYHHSQMVTRLLGIARDFGLLISGGSDFHGFAGRDNLGEPTVPYSLLQRIKETLQETH